MTTLLQQRFAQWFGAKLRSLGFSDQEADRMVEALPGPELAAPYAPQPVVPAVPPAQVLKRPATPFRPSILFDETPNDKLDWPEIE